MKLLRECTADDTDLQDFVYAVTEWEGEGVPAPREIADLLGVPTDEIQNRKRKLARRFSCGSSDIESWKGDQANPERQAD
jgi:hypothetical protein